MKTVIVRTPETDRKLLEIPTKLSDLTDKDGNAITEVVGLARLTAGTKVPGSTFRDTSVAFQFDDWPIEKNVTTVKGGFVVPAAGLYMVAVNVDWVRGGTIAAPNAPPTAASRTSVVLINDDTTSAYVLDKSDFNNGVTFIRAKDSGTFTIPLEAGDSVKVYLSWDSSIDTTSGGGDINRASLSLYRLP